jgi:hypothetical protein
VHRGITSHLRHDRRTSLATHAPSLGGSSSRPVLLLVTRDGVGIFLTARVS